MKIRPARSFRSKIALPGDKSITHRAYIFGALARGVTVVEAPSRAEDCASTRRCLEGLGIRFEGSGSSISVHGAPDFIGAPGPLDCGNSGTTIRLLMGTLAGTRSRGATIETTLVGDGSLSRRPMERVARPLREMGAIIETTGGTAPVRVRSTELRGAALTPEAASAQIKSAILLAGIGARGTTVVREAERTRDHTERMIGTFGGRVRVSGNSIEIEGGQELRAATVRVPSDPSSAAAFVVAALILKDSEVEFDNVLLNPLRIRYLELLREMGASISIEPDGSPDVEPRGRVVVRSSELRAIEIAPSDVPAIIDELPLLAVAGAFSKGRLVVRGASELRVKESDRIRAMAQGLTAMGASIEEKPDGFSVEGGAPIRGASVTSHGDHRIAMALAVAGLGARGDTEIQESESVAISFPAFFKELERGALV